MSSAKRFQNIVEGIEGTTLILAHLLLFPLRPWRLKWGATPKEVRRTLPGDELVPQPRWAYTHGITIHAPVAAVWPWVVQMGQGRGGFYSYEGLENLLGCEIHNADHIVPELQDLKPGDGIRLHPQMPALNVARVEPERALVLHGDTRAGGLDFRSDQPSPDHYFASTWTFFLYALEEKKSRLLSRFRSDYSTGWANRLMYGPLLVEPISFVMDRKMLLGIKARAERAAG